MDQCRCSHRSRRSVHTERARADARPTHIQHHICGSSRRGREAAASLQRRCSSARSMSARRRRRDRHMTSPPMRKTTSSPVTVVIKAGGTVTFRNPGGSPPDRDLQPRYRTRRDQYVDSYNTQGIRRMRRAAGHRGRTTGHQRFDKPLRDDSRALPGADAEDAAVRHARQIPRDLRIHPAFRHKHVRLGRREGIMRRERTRDQESRRSAG